MLYQHYRKSGFDPIRSVFHLFSPLYSYLRMRTKGIIIGNVINGFYLIEKPLLVSYSRSGTNWIRYIIEYISNKPTPGQTRLHSGADYVIDRAHKGYPVLHHYNKVILLIRNYRECLLRHHSSLWTALKDAKAFLLYENVEQPPIWFIKNIEAFDKFEGEKLLIYYEDLLNNPEPIIKKLSRFLGLDIKKTEDFILNIEDRQQESISAYIGGGHESFTLGERNQTNYHANTNLSKEEQLEFDNFYKLKYPYLFDKYLKKYAIHR